MISIIRYKEVADLKKNLAAYPSLRRTSNWTFVNPVLSTPPAPFSLFASNLTKRQYCAEVTVKKSLAVFERKWRIYEGNKRNRKHLSHYKFCGINVGTIESIRIISALNINHLHNEYMFSVNIYTKPPKDNAERTERMQHPCRLRTRLMFCDLLEE